MRIFISAGEPSGDLHAGNLVSALRKLEPSVHVAGFGGTNLANAGADVLFPLCQFAVVGLFNALKAVPQFREILQLAKDHFREHKPDAVILVDYPGFHWWVARAAKEAGIPVYYFVPPQLWAWAGWRVHKMRRLIDEVFTTLPFEDSWYRERNVPTCFIGHPYFDALERQQVDRDFVKMETEKAGSLVALLPGSRTQEVRANWSSLLQAARKIRVRLPDTRFLVACFKESHRELIERTMNAKDADNIITMVGKTPEIIAAAKSTLSVSGSVSLELLHQAKPFAIIYRIPPPHLGMYYLLRKTRFITLVNLLEDRLVCPEYIGSRCASDELANHTVGWLSDQECYRSKCDELMRLRDKWATPGACERAATHIIGRIRATCSQAKAA